MSTPVRPDQSRLSRVVGAVLLLCLLAIALAATYRAVLFILP